MACGLLNSEGAEPRRNWKRSCPTERGPSLSEALEKICSWVRLVKGCGLLPRHQMWSIKTFPRFTQAASESCVTPGTGQSGHQGPGAGNTERRLCLHFGTGHRGNLSTGVPTLILSPLQRPGSGHSHLHRQGRESCNHLLRSKAGRCTGRGSGPFLSLLWGCQASKRRPERCRKQTLCLSLE